MQTHFFKHSKHTYHLSQHFKLAKEWVKCTAAPTRLSVWLRLISIPAPEWQFLELSDKHRLCVSCWECGPPYSLQWLDACYSLMEHEKEFDQNILYRKGHYKRPTKSQKYLKKVSQGLDRLKADSTTVTLLVEIQSDLITNKVWETHRNSNEITWTVMKRNPEYSGSMICVPLYAQATDKSSTGEKGSTIKKMNELMKLRIQSF